MEEVVGSKNAVSALQRLYTDNILEML